MVAFALILKKLLTSKVAAGRIRPPPVGLNRINGRDSSPLRDTPTPLPLERDDEAILLKNSLLKSLVIDILCFYSTVGFASGRRRRSTWTVYWSLLYHFSRVP